MTILALGLIASVPPATAQEIRLGFNPSAHRRLGGSRAPIRARPIKLALKQINEAGG